MAKRSKLSEANASHLTVVNAGDTDIEETADDAVGFEGEEQEDCAMCSSVPEGVTPETFVSSGVTSLNLALTNHPLCGLHTDAAPTIGRLLRS